MTAIWSPENRYKIWWRIEVFAAEAMGRIGMIPAEDAAHGRVYVRFALNKPIMFQAPGGSAKERLRCSSTTEGPVVRGAVKRA